MAESDGLICAFLLDGNGGGRSMEWADIHAWQPNDGVIWLHLDYTGSESQRWMTEESGLTNVVSTALLAEETRPRCTLVDDALLINLRGVNLNPGAEPEDMVGVRVWIEENRIITVLLRRLMAIRDIHDEILQNIGPVSSEQFLSELIANLASRMAPVVEALSDRADEIEENTPTEDMTLLREELSDARRQLIGLRRFLAPQQDVLRQLLHVQRNWLTSEIIAHIGESAETTIRYVEELGAIRERIHVAQDEFKNRASEDMNKTMFRLTLVATIMLPMNLLTSLLGINVAGIPVADKPWAFALVLVLLVVFGVGEIILMRWMKWI